MRLSAAATALLVAGCAAQSTTAGSFTVVWRPGDTSMEVEVAYPSNPGYVSIALSDDATMLGSTGTNIAVVGVSGQAVKVYRMTAKNTPGMAEMTTQQALDCGVDLTGSSLVAAASSLTLKFKLNFEQSGVTCALGPSLALAPGGAAVRIILAGYFAAAFNQHSRDETTMALGFQPAGSGSSGGGDSSAGRLSFTTPDYELKWAPGATEMEVNLTSKGASGWVGLAYSADGTMLGASGKNIAIVGTGTGTVTAYLMSDKTTGGMGALDSATALSCGVDLSGASAAVAGGSLTLSFKLRYAMGVSSCPVATTLAVARDGPQFGVVLAHGLSSVYTKHVKHASAFALGTVGDARAGTEIARPLLLPHAACMAAAWFVLAPLGICSARYHRRRSWWFQCHRLLHIIAFVATVVGFVLAVMMTSDAKSSHFYSLHAKLGLAFFCFDFIQPALGFLRPDKEAPRRAAWSFCHRLLGWLMPPCAMILGCLGADRATEHRDWLLPVAITGACLVPALFALREYLTCRRRREGASPQGERGEHRSGCVSG